MAVRQLLISRWIVASFIDTFAPNFIAGRVRHFRFLSSHKDRQSKFYENENLRFLFSFLPMLEGRFLVHEFQHTNILIFRFRFSSPYTKRTRTL